jgi:8-amino-7-oxononanoate synthase
MSLDQYIHERLGQLEKADLRRTLLSLEGPTGPYAVMGGRKFVNLCSNDYLALAGDPRLIKAAGACAEKWGAGAGASRLVTGNLACHEELEEEIASFLGYEAALCFGSGYHANTGLIPALAGESDLLFSDELNHASIIDGCRLSKARRLTFRHRDMDNLENLLKKHRRGARHAIVLTESVFSMDGNAPDFAALAALCGKYDAALIVDEAHALGVVGDGRGMIAANGLQDRACAVVGTFGKAFGAFGAFVACSKNMRELLINTARSAIFSTALPPPVVGAALEAVRIIKAEGADLTRRLAANARALVDAARTAGFDVPDPAGAIVPVVIGGEKETLRVAQDLYERGVLARGIRPPTVPKGSSRLRLTACAGHTSADIQIISDAFGQLKNA